MGQVLNWVALMGLVLILGGAAMLVFAGIMAMRLVQSPLGPGPGPGLRPTRPPSAAAVSPQPVALAPQVPGPRLPTSRAGRGRPAVVRPPLISRSVLLADTVSLHQLGDGPG